MLIEVWRDSIKAAKASAVLTLSAMKLGEGLTAGAAIIIIGGSLTAPFIYSQFGMSAEPINIDFSERVS